MRLLHWCMLGVTILLLVCEVTISQLCNSLIMLVDGFHTLFILIHMALLSSQTASKRKPPLSILNPGAHLPHASSSLEALPTNLPAESSIKPLPGTKADTDGPTLPDQAPPPTPTLHCGLSYTNCRIQAVGTFISALLLASLCLAYIMEIIGFSLEPKPVQRPLLPVVVSTVSLLHKMLGLWLYWDQQETSETDSLSNISYKGLAEEESKGQAEPGRVLYDVSLVRSAMDDSLHNGALVLCNPRTSVIPDIDSQTPEPKAQVHLRAAAPQDSKDCEADLSNSENITKIYNDNTSIGYLGKQSASFTTPVCSSSHHIKRPVPTRQWTVRLLSVVLVLQGLCTSFLALINSLVMLLISPQSLHSSGACSLLVYLDPGLSLMAVVILIATATKQVHRYGLLLLQATPPHVCVSDLGRRIASVPGVKAVHDLHIWQLTESFMVASVHVHCHASFPAHRYADLMSGVTKVLQSVGVSCCTVQPEFACCSGSSADNGDASPVVHREDPSLPPIQTCNLTCGKSCTGHMCCSPSEEEGRSMLVPPTGEMREEAQTLVIENTIL